MSTFNTGGVDYETQVSPITAASGDVRAVTVTRTRPTNGVFRKKYRTPKDPVCSHCGSSEGVELEDSRTAKCSEPYTLWVALIYDDKPPDPNAPILLCRECAEEHNAWWDEQWAEYNASRG